MLTFFIDPYEEEIMSSIVARYNVYSGNLNLSKTSMDLFGKYRFNEIKQFPLELSYLEKELEYTEYTAEYFIYKHTLFPFYSPFIRKENQYKLIKYLKGEEKASGSPNILNKEISLKYCPICVEENIKKYGEAYYKRFHQIEGINICNVHRCLLYKYPYEKVKNKNKSLIYLEKDKLCMYPLYYDKFVDYKIFKIIDDIEYILHLEPLKYSYEEIIREITVVLKRKKYLTVNGLKKKRLHKEIRSYYGMNLLKALEICKNEDEEFLKNFTLDVYNEQFELIKMILLIKYLFGDIKKIFEEIDKRVKKTDIKVKRIGPYIGWV